MYMCVYIKINESSDRRKKTACAEYELIWAFNPRRIYWFFSSWFIYYHIWLLTLATRWAAAALLALPYDQRRVFLSRFTHFVISIPGGSALPRSPAPRVSLAGGAAVCSSSSPLYCFPSQSLFPPNSQSIRSDVTLYIYLCVAARSVVKSRRLTCPLGKSMALLFTALGLLLLLLRQDRYNSFLFLSFLLALARELFFLGALCFFWVFFFLPLLLNRISRLVKDSNVNRWKAFAKSQKLRY